LIRKNQLLLFFSFLAFISLGLPDGLLGVAWPSMAGELGQPLSRLALLQLSATGGFFISSTNAGGLIRRLGVGRLLILSNVMVFIALAGFSLATDWFHVVLAMFILGTGGGAVDAGLNGYSAERFTKEQVTLLHAFYGLGAMIGPVIMRTILIRRGPWQGGYRITLVLVGLLLLLFIRFRHHWDGKPREKGKTPINEGAPCDTCKDPGAVKFRTGFWGILLFFIYTGLEVTLGGWSFTWLTRGCSVEPERAALWVGIYWGALMTGRVFFGFIGGRWHIRSILSWMIGTVVMGCVLFFQPWFPGVSLFSMPLLGFACAPLFPLFVSYTPEVTGRSEGTVWIGRQVAAASIGSAVVPLLVGLGVSVVSLRAIPMVLLVLSALLAVLYRLWVAHTPLRTAGLGKDPVR
jgi:fucose permease